MPDSILIVLLAVQAYLIGGVPFSLIIGRVWGVDVRKKGSGNVGAVNVLRTAGRIPGALAFAADIGKGAAAVYIASLINPFNIDTVLLAAAFSAVLGHVFPLYLKLSGGKGVATGAGGMLVLCPAALLSSVAVYFIGLFSSHKTSSVGSIAAAVSFPLFLTIYYLLFPGIYSIWFNVDYGWFLVTGLLLIVLIVIKHIPNIRRLIRGNENRLGSSSSDASGKS